MVGRWLQLLSKFHFVIVHREGKYHLNADALSRIPPRRCPRKDCPNCYPSMEEINWMTLNGLYESICPEPQILNECFSSHLDEITIQRTVCDEPTSKSDDVTTSPLKPDGGWTLSKLRTEQILILTYKALSNCYCDIQMKNLRQK